MGLAAIRWNEPRKPREGELPGRLEKDGYEVSRWPDDAAADYQPHAHDHDESLWMVQGEVTFGVGEERHTLRPGDRLMLPKGTVHNALAGTEGCLYLIGQRP